MPDNSKVVIGVNSCAILPEHELMWKDTPVMRFNILEESVSVLDSDMLPVCIRSSEESYDMIRKFCSLRILMLNREYCKEILLACGIDDQSPVNICLVSRGLSLRDNYWIRSTIELIKWDDVNPYKKTMSNAISSTALTGTLEEEKDLDRALTMELTSKGVRAKCFIKRDGAYYLLKRESESEMNAEVLSYYVAKLLGIESARYLREMYGKYSCVSCRIDIDENHEMILFRDVMSYYGENTPELSSECVKHLIHTKGCVDMFLFDFLTLNVDRNRDNFGFRMVGNKIGELYPLYDHDSCFKTNNTNSLYFPLSIRFNNLLQTMDNFGFLKNMKSKVERSLTSLRDERFKKIFVSLRSIEDYDAFMDRVKSILDY